MTFWSTVLACMLGFLFWDLIVSFIKVGTRTIKERMKEKARKIGFGDMEEDSGRKTKASPQMRKIGFGENE